MPELDDLVRTYVEAAVVHRDATSTGNYKAGTRAAKQLQTVYQELRSRGQEGENRIVALLGHEDARVRGWAAADVLDFAPHLAVPVLEALVDLGGLLGFDAEMVLKHKAKKP